jgi:type IV pilus assembly protein PilV
MDAKSPSRSHAPSRRRAAGVGLIEILIAVTILAFGLLGIAAMQATTLRNSQSASERSEAVVGTYAILERMRANYAVASNGGYDLAAMTCNAPIASNLVTSDQHDWIEALHESLGASACGQISGCGGDTCTITVQWDDTRGTNGKAETESDNKPEQFKLVTETRL